jgi:hypothetical protein
MKPLNANANHDQNWQWPEKTWFRERLNALKAQENGQRRKPLIASTGADQVSPAAPGEKADPKVD